MFLANYSDGLTDVNLDDMIERFKQSGKLACFLAVRPPLTYHLADIDADGRVREFRSSDRSDIWINAGYFLLRAARSSTTCNEGEELVLEPFQRLIEADQLMAYKHEGFWRCHGHAEGPAGARGDGREGQDALARQRRPPGSGRTLSIAGL